jgi:hypothetical protein
MFSHGIYRYHCLYVVRMDQQGHCIALCWQGRPQNAMHVIAPKIDKVSSEYNAYTAFSDMPSAVAENLGHDLQFTACDGASHRAGALVCRVHEKVDPNCGEVGLVHA